VKVEPSNRVRLCVCVLLLQVSAQVVKISTGERRQLDWSLHLFNGSLGSRLWLLSHLNARVFISISLLIPATYMLVLYFFPIRQVKNNLVPLMIHVPVPVVTRSKA
jgi:hypothetical protein